ncbi:MAG: 2-succinylbenzoate--CoA ligase [Microcoleaceae cyanobacterium]
MHRNRVIETAISYPSSSEQSFKSWVNLSPHQILGCTDRGLTQSCSEQIQRIQEFNQNKSALPTIFLAESSPEKFLGSFIAATSQGCPLFLCNPKWSQMEWQQVFQLVQPDLVWGESNAQSSTLTTPKFCHPFPKEYGSPILIPTGGSSGKIRFAIHSWQTLTASVQGFQSYFQSNISPLHINSFCTLPLYHVSGLMQFLRSYFTHGKLAIFPFKHVEMGQVPDWDFSDFFISLVPTQLQRLLAHEQTIKWLKQFHTVFLGGAPAHSELLERVKDHRIQLAPTYGMTETAAQVATLKPQDFLTGNYVTGKNIVGQVLPHARIILDSQSEGNSRKELSAYSNRLKTGLITIKSDALMWGYYQPESKWGSTEFTEKLNVFKSDDLGYFDDVGNLSIIGRNSRKIITGGENVFPAEVEAKILATQLVQDVRVLGLPDIHWGEVITAVYLPQSNQSNSEPLAIETLKSELQTSLSSYKIPKLWIPVEQLPYNSQGKVNLEIVRQMAFNHEIYQNSQRHSKPENAEPENA